MPSLYFKQSGIRAKRPQRSNFYSFYYYYSGDKGILLEENKTDMDGDRTGRADRADGTSSNHAAIMGGTGTQVIDPVSTEWTDEKHVMFLNSIEASFIDKLYNSECRSKDVPGWFSKKLKHPNSSGSHVYCPLSGQFKVQRGGCWENLNFEKARSRIDIENESRLLSANQWIKHFRSPFIGKVEHYLSSDGTDNKTSRQLIDLPRQRHGKDVAVEEQLPASCSQIFHRDSVGSHTEVSDQNFVDSDFEAEEKLGHSRRRKRVKTSLSDVQFKDQVVPCDVPSISDRKHACPKGPDAELVPGPPSLKDQ